MNLRMLNVVFRVWPASLAVVLLASALAVSIVYAQLGDEQRAAGVINAISTAGLLPGDANEDGLVDGADLRLVTQNWFARLDTSADLNGDGLVDVQDLAIVARNFGRSL